ncbi:hypothetical protein [Shinella sp. JR1-6]|uniref:hypothetical protein n=1 Tax=Shinella sp. JR1-6 TaxID=2527671 RepID=UPI00102D3966|nr:hypothetical protein [Shinella sp. JR1-6]TAA54842.1 hypothetical protein EXZ48_26095 [Shinella sp. JR1-6]
MRRELELILACLVLGITASVTSYRWGYDDASAKAAADQAWVNQQMEQAGFCVWVRQASFASHCTSVSSGGGE